MEQLVQHEFGKIMPRMSDEQYSALKDDIAKNGLLFPITIYESKVLDGWHRYLACAELKVDYKTTQYQGDSPVSYIVSASTRRDLNEAQKAALGVIIKPLIADEIKRIEIERRKQIRTSTSKVSKTLDKKNGYKRTSAYKAAKTAGSSQASVNLAEKLQKELPEEFEKLKAGKLTLKDAKNKLYKKKEAEKKSTVDVEIENKDIQLHNKDISDVLIADNSINLILTDPPYPRGYLPCWSKLARFASEKLKDGGVLLAMSGQSYLPEVYANMKYKGLEYYWTLALNQPKVPTILQTKRLNCFWKPILVYVKGDYKGTFQPTDVYSSDYEDTKEGKAFHEWGQNYEVFSKLITDWSYAGDVVCDPFLGGGTCGVAAIRNKRKFIGVEILKDVYLTAKQRIAEALQ